MAIMANNIRNDIFKKEGEKMKNDAFNKKSKEVKNHKNAVIAAEEGEKGILNPSNGKPYTDC